MKKLLIFVYFLPFLAQSQHFYWQQKAEYSMDIRFDAGTHRYTGKQILTYTNNSPDTLDRFFYHLYFNAFQPGSSMDVRSRLISDPDKRVADRISKLNPQDIGYQKILTLKQNGKPVSFQTEGTILEVKPAQLVPPGAKTTLEMTFEAQVPIQIRRSGRMSQDGIDYSMTQWYPKMCEYDRSGWHPNPYIGREFYGIFGNFDVKITIDSSYVVGATGVLQNPEAVGHGYITPDKVKRAQNKEITWHFRAENVHDFAWAADPDYVHETETVDGGPVLHFLFKDGDKASNFRKAKPYLKEMFRIMKSKFGAYPYPQFSFIEGGDGGMEYPMMTLVVNRGNLNGLIGVCVHEAIHNWYYGVLGTNESRYPWMDEGFTTFAEDEVMNEIMNYQDTNPHEGSYLSYLQMIKSTNREPLTTHADFYKTNRTYSISSYSAGSVFLAQLSYIVGEKAFRSLMLRYFEQWKFRHPDPEAFILLAEKVSGMQLDWYREQFVESLNSIDYGIRSVSPDPGGTRVHLERKGDFPMPLDLLITYTDGRTERHYIPLDLLRGEKENAGIVHTDWPWVYTDYSFVLNSPIGAISSIRIDPAQGMADIDLRNQQWPAAGGIIFEAK